MKTSKVSAVLAVLIIFLAGLTASEAKQQYAWFDSMDQAERVVGRRKNLQILPYKKEITFEEAKKKGDWTDLEGARQTKAKKYLVVWDGSSAEDGDGKQIAEGPFEPDPEPRDVPEDREREKEPCEKRGFFGQLFGSLIGSLSINVQPTLSGGYGGSYGGECVPDFVPPRRVYYSEPAYCPPPVVRHQVYYREPAYCPPVRTTAYCPPPRNSYCPPTRGGRYVGGSYPTRPSTIIRSGNQNINGNSNRTVVNNSVRVPRDPTPTRSSSGPTFARNVKTPDPAGPTRPSGGGRRR